MSEDIIAISGINPRQCMKCGKCSATCPAFEEMDIHPHQFASMVVEGRIDELLQSKSIWKCLSCFACVERCPRSVEPAKLIEAVRVTVLRERGGSFLSPDEVPHIILMKSRDFGILPITSSIQAKEATTQQRGQSPWARSQDPASPTVRRAACSNTADSRSSRCPDG